jgi:DEAD/DEAH box helicase domain-containing protein
MKILIYDCEIVNCIPVGELDPNLTYCKGWTDFKGMGISLIGAWWNGKIWIFTEAYFPEFQAIVKQADLIVGFNSIGFDDKLCAAHGIEVTTSLDLLCEVRVAAGMPPEFVAGVTRPGYSLDAICKANFGKAKTGRGDLAPIWWQQGQRQKVVDYLKQDVQLTYELYQAWEKGEILDPTTRELLSFVTI